MHVTKTARGFTVSCTHAEYTALHKIVDTGRNKFSDDELKNENACRGYKMTITKFIMGHLLPKPENVER